MDIHVGFIDRFILIDENVLLKIRRVTIKDYFSHTCQDRDFHCKNIVIGAIQSEENDVFINPYDVIEKLVHFQEAKNKYFFFRFPSLMEST